MPGKAYSAGTIFLQVVPVFKDVMEEIRRNSKDWNQALGDELEKGGHDAGRRADKAIGEELGKNSKESGKKAGDDYSGAFAQAFKDGVKKTNRELDAIQVDLDTKGLRTELEAIKKEFKEFGDLEIDADLDAKDVYAQLRILKARLAELKDQTIDIRAKTDLDEAEKGVDAFIRRVERATAKINVDVDTKPAERAMGAFETRLRSSAKRAARELGDAISPKVREIAAELETLGDVNIGVDMDGEAALAHLREIYLKMKAEVAGGVGIDVEIDFLAAMSALAAVDVAAGHLDGKTVSIDIDTNDAVAATAKIGALSAMLALFRGNAGDASASGQEVANSFRAFNGVILAAVTLLPAMVPALAAVGGGLLALMPILAAVGGGLAAVVIGFSGIGKAVTALGQQQDSAAKDSQQAAQTMVSAANSVADAQTALARAEQQASWARADAARAVARAKEEAAQSIADALKQQERAQQDYEASVKDVNNAEKSLAQARRDAANELLALNDKVAQNQLDIQQGVIDVFNAQTNLNTVMSDGSSTQLDKDQASLQLQQAELQLKELREQQAQLAKEKAKDDKKGVDGTDTVKNAQDQLTNALQAQGHAQQALQDSAEALTKARVDGARAVADAERNAARVAITSAQSTADAKKALTRAEQAYGDALTKTGELGSASTQAVNNAMDKLSPAGRKFARFIFGLKKQFYEFRGAIQQALLPPVQKALQKFINVYGGQMTKFFVRLARVAGQLFGDLGKALRGPAFKQFFAMMAKFGPHLLRQFGKTAIDWIKIFARFMTISGPAAGALSKAMLQITKSLLKWVNSKKGTETIQRFLDYARKVGPSVVTFFEDLVVAIGKILIAVAPFGEIILKALDGVLKFINGLDPKTLTMVVGLILGLVAAFQLTNAAVFVAYGAFSALATTVGLWVFIISALIVLAVVLYVRYAKFREIVNKVFGWIVWYFKNVVFPVFKFYGEVVVAAFKYIEWGWINVLIPVFKAIAKIVTWLWEKIFKPVFKFIWTVVHGAFVFIRAAWNNILFPILDLIGTVIYLLFKKYWKPAVDKMLSVWNDWVTGAKFLWNTVLGPILDKIGDKVLPKFQKAWEDVVAAIGVAWGLLKKYVAAPLVAIFDLVVNKGLIAGFNKIASFVGSKQMSTIDLPFDATGEAVKKAQGGVLPGYTPGRDVHKFYSPTGGRLELSGGEAVMRPEFTYGAGKGWVDYMNHVARTQGAAGVRAVLNGGVGHYFAKGGVYGDAYAKGGVLKNPDAPVTVSGYKIAAIFAAQMAIARKLYGSSWGLLQGGYGGNNYGPSGTSHDYPGVGDIYNTGGTSFTDQSNARKVGLWGWARNIPGAAYVGSGAHVHALSAFSPGTKASPQRSAYINGGDGLGGSDYGPRPAMIPNIVDLLSSFDMSNIGSFGGGAKVIQHNYPSFLAQIIKGPVDWAKGLITKPLQEFKNEFNSPLAGIIGDIPGMLVKKFASKALDIIPAVSAFNEAGKLIHGAKGLASDAAGAVAGAVGLANGGIIPYNGTMKYDAGGYLPPGITSVVNLTGRPEPVLTHDQFGHMAANQPGETFHYEPHFEGSDLTAEDVARDMEQKRRKMRLEGKYAGAKS